VDERRNYGEERIGAVYITVGRKLSFSTGLSTSHGDALGGILVIPFSVEQRVCDPLGGTRTYKRGTLKQGSK
jgi:hypothetical protein